MMAIPVTVFQRMLALAFALSAFRKQAGCRTMTEALVDKEGAICQAEMLRNGLSTYSLWINIYVSSIGNLDTSNCFMTYEQARRDLLSRTSEKGLLPLDCGRYLAYVYSIVIVPYGVGSIASTRIYDLRMDMTLEQSLSEMEKEKQMALDLLRNERYPS